MRQVLFFIPFWPIVKKNRNPHTHTAHVNVMQTPSNQTTLHMTSSCNTNNYLLHLSCHRTVFPVQFVVFCTNPVIIMCINDTRTNTYGERQSTKLVREPPVPSYNNSDIIVICSAYIYIYRYNIQVAP